MEVLKQAEDLVSCLVEYMWRKNKAKVGSWQKEERSNEGKAPVSSPTGSAELVPGDH